MTAFGAAPGIQFIAMFDIADEFFGIFTCPAYAVSSGEPVLNEIVTGERMPFRAMRFGRIERHHGIASQLVLAVGRRSTMERIAAPSCSVVADIVIEFGAGRDRANFSLVSNAIDETHSSVHAHHRVSVARTRLPDVAAIGVGDPAVPLAQVSPLPRTPWDEHTDDFGSLHWGEDTILPPESP